MLSVLAPLIVFSNWDNIVYGGSEESNCKDNILKVVFHHAPGGIQTPPEAKLFFWSSAKPFTTITLDVCDAIQNKCWLGGNWLASNVGFVLCFCNINQHCSNIVGHKPKTTNVIIQTILNEWHNCCIHSLPIIAPTGSCAWKYKELSLSLMLDVFHFLSKLLLLGVVQTNWLAELIDLTNCRPGANTVHN